MCLLQFFISKVNSTKSYSLAVLLSLLAFSANAEQLSSQFNVTVNFLSLGAASKITANSAFCRSTNGLGSFGATVTIGCSSGAVVDVFPSATGNSWSPLEGGTYRYIFQASRNGQILGTVDSYVGGNNETSWKTVTLAEQEYIELLIDW